MRYYLFLTILIVIINPLFTQSDYSLKKVIQSTTFKYFEDTEGDFVINYKTRTGRDQKVIIRNDTNTFQQVNIREILSIAKIFKSKPISENLSNYLLIDNYSTKYIGNWAIHKKDDIMTIIFIVKLPYNSGIELIEAAIIESAEAADALEKALEDEIENSKN
ncbi:hypothetical protein EW093_00485 [Thiospirochaeta perfilievii]|uniref:Uncharacterized protein n=1 Tax=Thiospirochaeta perfilievii TaxID=252967 RepID=A0A5C1Q6X5_9SPIO|nr:hypothetical protein [Thiospirochaeta perfilievii]QEN03241.1 hypothetical protein EW093_00485 [Thiospirochaeta perfilievii]